MTPRQVLEEAALSLEKGVGHYACIEIKKIAGMYGVVADEGMYIAGETALGMFKIMFEPSSTHSDGGWWEPTDAGRLARVRALRHTASFFD